MYKVLPLIVLLGCAANQSKYDGMLSLVNATAEGVESYAPLIERVCVEVTEPCKKAEEAYRAAAIAVDLAHLAMEGYRRTGIGGDKLERALTRVSASLAALRELTNKLEEANDMVGEATGPDTESSGEGAQSPPVEGEASEGEATEDTTGEAGGETP